MIDLSGKTAVITGASKGIGFAAATLFLQHGAKVVITGRGSEALALAEKELSTQGDVLAVQGDMATLSDIDKLYQCVAERHDGIDILFVNAGLAERAWTGDVTEAFFDSIVNINYKGTFFSVQKALPLLNKGASVILNASIAALIGIDHHTVYSSSKAAVIQLAKTFSADLLSRSIRVNAISPGYIKTPIWDKWLEGHDELFHEFAQQVPFERRFGTALEIAKPVLFLASSESSYMTGQNLVVDGGLTTLRPEYAN